MARSVASFPGSVMWVSSMLRPRVLESANRHSTPHPLPDRRLRSKRREGPAIEIEGPFGIVGVGGDDERLVTLDSLRGEAQARRRCHRHTAQPALPHAPPALAQQRAELVLSCILKMQIPVFLETDGERNVVFAQEFHPPGADELAIGQQHLDGGGPEQRQIAPHQGNALRGAGIALMIEQRPEQRKGGTGASRRQEPECSRPSNQASSSCDPAPEASDAPDSASARSAAPPPRHPAAHAGRSAEGGGNSRHASQTRETGSRCGSGSPCDRSPSRRSSQPAFQAASCSTQNAGAASPAEG